MRRITEKEITRIVSKVLNEDTSKSDNKKFIKKYIKIVDKFTNDLKSKRETLENNLDHGIKLISTADKTNRRYSSNIMDIYDNHIGSPLTYFAASIQTLSDLNKEIYPQAKGSSDIIKMFILNISNDIYETAVSAKEIYDEIRTSLSDIKDYTAYSGKKGSLDRFPLLGIDYSSLDENIAQLMKTLESWNTYLKYGILDKTDLN